jgi:hypothetical protein
MISIYGTKDASGKVVKVTREYETVSKFWVCKVDEIEVLTEIGAYNDGTPRVSGMYVGSLNCEPERWFQQKASAVKWIAENQGEWRIVEVFSTTKKRRKVK